MAKEITQAEAIRVAFLNLCAQYQQLGEQLKAISELITPILEGEQQIVPARPCIDDGESAKLN